MGRLETLSVAIGQLNPASSEKNSPAATGGNGSAAGNSNFGAKNSHDSQKLDRWQPDSINVRENNVANQSTKSVKRKMLVRQKISIATDDEISETWNKGGFILRKYFLFGLILKKWKELLSSKFKFFEIWPNWKYSSKIKPPLRRLKND